MTSIGPGTTSLLACCYSFKKCRAYGLLAIVFGKGSSTPTLQALCITQQSNFWTTGDVMFITHQATVHG